MGSSSQSGDKRSTNSAAILRSLNFDRAIADQVFDRCGQGDSKQHALLEDRAIDCHGSDALHRGTTLPHSSCDGSTCALSGPVNDSLAHSAYRAPFFKSAREMKTFKQYVPLVQGVGRIFAAKTARFPKSVLKCFRKDSAPYESAQAESAYFPKIHASTQLLEPLLSGVRTCAVYFLVEGSKGGGQPNGWNRSRQTPC